MRILYGVVGEGMGHATRSRVVIEHLLARGHEVRVVASGRASGYLAERVASVGDIWGLTMAYSENEVRRWQTLARNLSGAVSGWPQNVREYFRIVEEFAPDAVLSDFESFAWLFGRRHRLPVISVDNIQIIDRCRHDEAITAGHQADFELARALVRWKPRLPPLPGDDLLPPAGAAIADDPRPVAAAPRDPRGGAGAGDHLLVYQTAEGNEGLPGALDASGLECRVYGFRRDLDADLREGRILYRPFSEGAFIDDLRTARGVLTGGRTLLSECVHLGVPALSVPLAGQFEQLLNARYLERLGYGMYAPHATTAAIAAFAERLPDHRAALAEAERAGNGPALAAGRRAAGGRGPVNEWVRVGVLCAIALWFALIEIEIEGAHGWALRLPTWFRTGPAGGSTGPSAAASRSPATTSSWPPCRW